MTDTANVVAQTAPPGGGPAADDPTKVVAPAQVVDVALNAPPGGGNDAVIPPAPTATPPVTPAADAFKPVVADGDTEYTPTGDSRLDAAVHYFGNNLKLDLQSPEMVEASKGNFSYLEAKLEGMGAEAKDAKLYLQLAKDGLQAVQDGEKAKGEALVKTIHEAAGSPEAWNETKAYVQANLPQEQITVLNEVIGQGGIVATLLVSALRQQHMEHSGTVVGRDAVAPGVVAEPPKTYSFKSEPEWRQAYKALIAEHGIQGAAKQPEYQKLMAAFPQRR